MTQAAAESTAVLDALALPRQGIVVDLDSRHWRGMPVHPVHPRFEVLTYRSPRGQRNQRDLPLLAGNAEGYGFVSELISGTAHTGTHIDARCHVVRGERAEWYGGRSADEHLGDFGALSDDASELPPLVCRGVLLDVCAARGVEQLPAGYGVGSEDLELAASRQGVEVPARSAILVRTGTMRRWPDEEAVAASDGAGVSLDGARWLAEREPLALGADTGAFEVQPSGIEGRPQPVHVYLLAERGIPLLEWVSLEELAAGGHYEFLFVCLPLRIRGATASMVRPVAVI